MPGDRGQAFTLEGLLAALILLAGVVFALQAVVVTPSSSGTTAAPVDSERLDGVLRETAENGSLRRAILSWNASNGFHGSADVNWIVQDYPNNSFGRTLNQTVGESAIVNVRVQPNSSARPVRLIYNGIPGDGTVRATTVVAVYDTDPVRNATGAPVGAVENSTFYVSDQYTGNHSALYEVFRVEVVAWEP